MLSKRKLAFGTAVALSFFGCASTKYAPMSMMGQDYFGYAERSLDSNAWAVTFDGNKYTDFDFVDKCVLYRSSELTMEKGFDYFVVLDREHDSSVHNFTIKADSSLTPVKFPDPMHNEPPIFNLGWPTAFDSPGTEHRESKLIRMFRGKIPSGDLEALEAKPLRDSLWFAVEGLK
jgi:hypothetical protein